MQIRNQSIRIVFYATAMIAMLVVTPTVCWAAEGDLVWATRAGGTDRDGGDNVAALPDGSALVAGHFEGMATFGPDGTNETTLTSAGGEDVFVARYNPDGTLGWAKRAGSASREACYAIAALPNGGALVAGYFGGSAGDVITFGAGETNETTLVSAGDYDVFVAKYGPDGTLAWAKRAGGQFADVSYAIAASADGGALVTGFFAKSGSTASNTATYGPGEPNETTLVSVEGQAMFVARYNANGTLAWAKAAGGEGFTWATSIAALPDGSMLVGGSFSGLPIFGSGEPNQTMLRGTEGDMTGFFLAQYSPDGTLAWAKNIGGTSTGLGFVYAIEPLADGHVLVTGDIGVGTATFGHGEPNETTVKRPETGRSQLFLAKYNPDATVVWARGVTGSPGGMAALPDGSMLVSGSFSGTETFGVGDPNETELTSVDYHEVFIAKYYPNGELACVVQTGATGLQGGAGLAVYEDGTAVATRCFHDTLTFGPGEPNETTLTSAGNYDVFVAKYWFDPNSEGDYVPDADGDGLPDSVETDTGTYVDETDTGTDPYDCDTDADGLNDGNEILVYGTDPFSIDTDEDGLSDNDEVEAGADPVDPDTDGDGVEDGEDTDPLNPPSEWETLHRGMRVGDIWGASGDDVFALAGEGRIIHYDGVSWSAMETGTEANFAHIWGASGDDVFAVGYEGIIHYDGTSWSMMDTGAETYFSGIWGTSGDDVYALAAYGIVLHYDGTSWSPMERGIFNDLQIYGGLYSIWGTSGDDIFVACGRHGMLHYDGVSWSNVVSVTGDKFLRVWGLSSTDVFALARDSVGVRGRIYHYDGVSWSRMLELDYGLSGIWGASGDDVFVSGGNVTIGGRILHYDGVSWTEMTWPSELMARQIWGASSDDVFMIASGSPTGSIYNYNIDYVAHYDGTSWALMEDTHGAHVPPEPAGFLDISTTLMAVWGTSGANVFAVGGLGAIFSYDGTFCWFMESGTSEELLGVWGTSDESVYAVGKGGTILHFDGSEWSAEESGISNWIWDVWGTAEDNIFAVGGIGVVEDPHRVILHYDGTTWNVLDDSDNYGLFGLWGASADDFFAVGDFGTILHYDGTEWSSMESGTTASLMDVWGTSGDDVFAVGQLSILHYDGTEWSSMENPAERWLNGVWGTSGDDVFAVGEDDSILHYDGTQWERITTWTDALYGLWSPPSGEMFAAGTDTTILRHPGPDTDEDGLPDSAETDTGIYVDERDTGTDPDNPDTDGDGLNDGDEVTIYGSNPLQTDSDGDGLNDGDEVNTYGTNPAISDTDGDALPDGDEVNVHGTDPLNADTDNDGLADGAEVERGTDPLDADTDGDGLTDGDEVTIHSTNPLETDSDGDGLDDGGEVNTHGTNPTLADTDGDGLMDGDEVTIHGTDPVGADSDGDDLSDGDEVNVYSTSPTSVDSDNDGLADGDEVNDYGSDPTTSDTDGDGLTDGDEVNVYGSDPTMTDTDADGMPDGSDPNPSTANYTPSISGLNLAVGPEPGDVEAVVYGTGFDLNADVHFGENEADVIGVAEDRTEITLVLPAGTGTVDVEVVNPDTGWNSVIEDALTYIPPPQAAVVYPDAGPETGGPAVIITGSDFHDSATVYFGTEAALWQEVSADGTQITVELPPGTGVVDVCVRNLFVGLECVLAEVFVYMPDSDGDHLMDAMESTIGSDPLSTDSDGDGLNDFDEVQDGTDPTLADTDGDGVADAEDGLQDRLVEYAGDQPTAVAAADFNGDGLADLAVANFLSSSISVLLGNGDGTFESVPEILLAACGPLAIAVSDFDGDGDEDLAVACFSASQVSVLLASGPGTFEDALVVDVTSGPHDIVAGDFNGDGTDDLATANYSTSEVQVLIGMGDGTFDPGPPESPRAFATGENPFAIAAADFDGDGALDAVTANFGSSDISVLSGAGDGTLAESARIATGAGPESVAVGDLDNDGIPDIVVANTNASAVSVYLSTEQNGGEYPIVFPTSSGPSTVGIVDFNGDGRDDVVSVNTFADELVLFLNRGAGDLAESMALFAGESPMSLAASDFIADGDIDLAVANYTTHRVCVVANPGKTALDSDGDGFSDAFEAAVGSDPLDPTDTPITHCDVNGSGNVDAVDVQLVVNHALGMSVASDCDLNHDDIVNAVDVQLIINAALGRSS